MEKINIAELLKDCPKGMELDCTMYNNVTLKEVSMYDTSYPIYIETECGFNTRLTKYGQNVCIDDAKCVIFPKGKTTWEGFVPPCQFKDGDIVVCGESRLSEYVSIFKTNKTDNAFYYHAMYPLYSQRKTFKADDWALNKNIRLATEEEKQKLFQAIKENGYKWNTKTKTLKKFPKFKVGDRIRQKGKTSTYTITDVNNAHYFCGKYVICDTCDNDWELVPNKFDITTLIPFESKVLVRNDNEQRWIPAFWGGKREDGYVTTFGWSKYCVPFAGNEHLVGKSDDCDEFYKTWK